MNTAPAIDTSELLDAAARHPLPPGHVCSAGPARFDADLVHHWLSTDAYWALGRCREAQTQTLAGTLAYGVYEEASGAQVGCARLVTDLAALAYLCDVCIAPAARGRGLGTSFVAAVLADLVRRAPHGMRRVLLATDDAHGVYAELGFTPLPRPAQRMVLGAP
ncbi:GNAT family N-acetyltransferase [Streptomyces sp. NPDC058372]|uniref:GNAT family N-acetyltransferase n=1 Tax=Streptomyces sp. NPDC058372 TaxID=3346464 RepID=UPI00364C05AA